MEVFWRKGRRLWENVTVRVWVALVLFQHGGSPCQQWQVGGEHGPALFYPGWRWLCKQFFSVKDVQGVILGLMAILCFSESEFLLRVILGVTLSSHSLLQLEDYRIIKVFMGTHRSEQTGGDEDDGGSMMLKYRTTVQWNCIFILCRPISRLTCVKYLLMW